MDPKFSQGDVVYCHHLHNEKEPARIIGPNKDGEYEYSIEGKARPVLVLGKVHRIWLETATKDSIDETGCALYKASGTLGYLVLPLQSKRPPEHVPSEQCPDPVGSNKISYVDLRPVCYPLGCLVNKVATMEPLWFGLIDKRLTSGSYKRDKWYRA